MDSSVVLVKLLVWSGQVQSKDLSKRKASLEVCAIEVGVMDLLYFNAVQLLTS